MEVLETARGAMLVWAAVEVAGGFDLVGDDDLVSADVVTR